MKSQEKKYYVYVLLDPRKEGTYTYGKYSFEYQPFYVGKGSLKRAYLHSTKSELNRSYNTFKEAKIKKILKLDLEPKIVFIQKDITENSAFDLEKKVIDAIGLKEKGGPLTNLTYGGCGGRKLSEATKKKISKIKKEWLSNKENHPMYGRKHSKKTLEKFKNRPKYKWSEEQKENLKNIRKEKKNPTQTLTWKCTDPDGKKYIVYGLGEFCRDHGLQQSHMHSVAYGKRNHHKGWKCEVYESNN